MEDGGAKLHLKDWLVRQVDGGAFEGLSWEDEDRRMFRIPWKHAAKKDYRQTEDAALFKAWAEYKGKYREGRDKADPTMWKTRLRCALNKSTDFLEVPERNQLDITEPYKVYRIQDHGSTGPGESPQMKDRGVIQAKMSPKSLMDKQFVQLHFQNQPFNVNKEEEQPCVDDPMREHMYCELTGRKTPNQLPAPLNFFNPGLTVSDFRLQVTLLYQGQRVMKVITSSPDGCFLLQGRVPLGSERIYGPCTAQQLSFPSPVSMSLPPCMADAMRRLLCHLERGVLLWVAPDGVFIKRFCQGRVYWSGPTARHTDRPNKLEREKTFKLLDVPEFSGELQKCLQGRGPAPSHKIELCFGEEFPDPRVSKSRKLIMAQVLPLFAVELLERFNLGETEETPPTFSTSGSAGEKM